MASKRRGGFRPPELRGTLGTLIRTTTGVVRDAIERGAREGRARFDDARTRGRRHDALADLGEIVLDLIRRGEIDLAGFPEARDLVRELDEIDQHEDDHAAAHGHAHPHPHDHAHPHPHDHAHPHPHDHDHGLPHAHDRDLPRAAERHLFDDRPTRRETPPRRLDERPTRPDSPRRLDERPTRPEPQRHFDDHPAQPAQPDPRPRRADNRPTQHDERPRRADERAAPLDERPRRPTDRNYPAPSSSSSSFSASSSFASSAAARRSPASDTLEDGTVSSGAVLRSQRPIDPRSTDAHPPPPSDSRSHDDRTPPTDPGSHDDRATKPAEPGALDDRAARPPAPERPDHRGPTANLRVPSRPFPSDPNRKGGISFDDDDLADYMHPDDVPPKTPPKDPDDHSA